MARLDRYNDKKEEIKEVNNEAEEIVTESAEDREVSGVPEDSGGQEMNDGQELSGEETADEETEETEEYEEPVRKRGKAGKIFAVILILLLAIGGFGLYRSVNATYFSKGVRINGVDVSRSDINGAVQKISDDANHVTIVQNGETVAEFDAAYTYDIAPEVEKYLKISAVDPRTLFSKGVDYTVPVLINGGEEETAEALKTALPNPEDVVFSKNAYVDYAELEIVDEVEGNNLDYTALAKGIESHIVSDEYGSPFEFDPSKYVAKPEVRAADLATELSFAKKYMSEGMVVRSGTGNEVTLTSLQMSKVIKYTPDGPEYSKEGAVEVAEEISEEYEPWQLTINTQEGVRTLNNYVVPGSVDIEKTAESIYQAAQSGESAKMYTNEPDVVTLKDHIEVSITNQKLYTVQNGKATHTIDVITGRPGWETVPGIFNVYYKDRDATLVGTEDDYYESHVEYWMPFNGGAGLHDATWHSVFGGDIYLSPRGSHGCVGMSLEDAETVYNIVEAGYLVVIYY